MIELDVYYFFWLATSVQVLDRIERSKPLAYYAESLFWARKGLESLQGDVGRAFPETARHAADLLVEINRILPPRIEDTPNLSLPISEGQRERLATKGTVLFSTLKTEGKRSFVLKVEDQRCLSSHTLMEKVENCFSQESWNALGDDAKRDLGECGRCLALERYTAAGFHALRGVECAIRQYILLLTGSLPHKRDWFNYIKTLTDNGADPNLTTVLDNIRSLDRNPLMHPEHWLDVDDAVGTFTICQTAIARLAAGITKANTAKGQTP
jgi:hypothetical protein